MNIGFIGTGNMGAAMAARLLDVGHTLTVWNRSAAKAQSLVANGAKLASTPTEAIRGAEVVFTSLMEDANFYSLFGSANDPNHAHGELFQHFAPGSIHVCLSTVSLECADWLTAGHAAANSGYLSAPVVGRPDAAVAGNLIQLIAGDAPLIDRVEPLCMAYSARFLRVAGPPRAANAQKLCINFFLISTIEAIAESYILAEKLGADRAMMAAFVESLYAHPGFKGYATRLRDRSTSSEQGFTLYGAAKDLHLVRAAAGAAACPVELADLASAKFQEALACGFSNFDISSIQELSRLHAGLDSKFAK